MKKYAFLMMAAAALTVTSCGGEETPEAPVEVESNTGNDMMNNLMQEGLNQAIQEVGEQLNDSTSELNQMMDTIKDVIEENSDVIEDKLEEGLDALNKSF